MAGLKLKIDGVDKLIKELQKLGSEATAKKIARRAATAAIRPMRSAARALVPSDTGSLKKSIASKVSVKGYGISAIVGSDTSVLKTGEKASEPDEGPRAARTLALTLFGHVSPGGKVIPGNNFLAEAYEQSASEAQQIFADKLEEGIWKEIGGG